MDELLPSELNTKNCGKFLEVSKDKLSVKYIGKGDHDTDVGVIQGNFPVPNQRLLYYFEISVKDRGEKGVKVTIGFTDRLFKMCQQPGTDNNSYGYSGEDGKFLHATTRRDAYGPTFTTNDIVGGGINFSTQEMFFTKNGKFLGTARKDVKGDLFPTVGLHSQNERVEVNFGQRPFLFDIEAVVQEERDRRHRQIESIVLPLSVSHSIVRSYLVHYGYKDTLQAFDSANGVTESNPWLQQNGNGSSHYQTGHDLDQRKALRQLVRDGDIDGAIAKLREWYPQILSEDKSTINFLLSTQKFIETVKSGSVEAAVLYARNMLSQFRGCSDSQDHHLQECLALLAYENPADSPVGYLFGPNQREVVADQLNAAVLATVAPGEDLPRSILERLLKQLTLCHIEKRALDGGQGEMFHLHKVLQGKDRGR